MLYVGQGRSFSKQVEGAEVGKTRSKYHQNLKDPNFYPDLIHFLTQVGGAQAQVGGAQAPPTECETTPLM